MATPEDPTRALAPGRIGPATVLFAALGATAPMVALTTVVPAAYARGGGPLVPLVFAVLGVVLLFFSVGYAAMARRMPFAGALYAYVARGLGRPAGVGAAWVALLSYTAVQLGLYGAAGAAVAPLLDEWFGLTAPWWAVAAVCWLIVTICGTWRSEIVGSVIAVLVTAEAAVLLGFAAADVVQAGEAGITSAAIVPHHVDMPVLGVLLATGVLAFVGFEITGAFAEETRTPRRDAGRSTYAVVVAYAVLAGGASWAVAVAAGPGRVAAEAQAHGSELLFSLGAARLAPWAITIGRMMLLVGLVVALIAVQATVGRYLFALGREQIFPRSLAHTARRTQAPRTASLTQSVIAALAIGAAVAAGVTDPAVLARRLAVLGGLGVLVLLLATALSALLHLNRVPDREGTFARFVAPLVSTVALGALCYLGFHDLPALLSVRTADRLIWIVPAALGAVALVGLLHAWMLRSTRPVIYAGIGQGGKPVTVSPALPKPRDPGAHRPERVKR